MVVPIEKLIQQIIPLGIVVGFGYIIYQKFKNNKTFLGGMSEKFEDNDVNLGMLKRGKL